MKEMNRLLLVLVIASALTGCNPDKLTLVSDQPGPPTNATTPAGFSVSPGQAYETVWKEPWALSKKHIWHIYADDKNYYIIDSFLGSSPRKAIKTGVVVDGHTGKIK